MGKGHAVWKLNSQITMTTGESLVLYTDGLTEAMNEENELYGEDRLMSLLDLHAASLPEEIINACIEDVKDFTGRTPLKDDLTILVVQRRPHEEED